MADIPSPRESPREIAAAWRPERAGRRSLNDLRDPVVEPDWGGIRVAASLAADEAVLWRDGAQVPAPDELLAALVDAFRALDAVVEGHVTTMALRSGEGALPAMPIMERPTLLIPKGMRKKSLGDDPFLRGRDHEARADAVAPEALGALETGERHAFVATDLLWLDGEPLAEVPLQERKRHLETILEPSYLVRVTPFVRPSARTILVTWGTLGFGALTYRAANSRYLAGEENPDRVVAPPPSAQRPR